MATILRPDGSISTVHPGNDETFTLEEMHEILGGYFIVLWMDQGEVLLGREFDWAGQAQYEGVPENRTASELYQQTHGFSEHIPIYGTVLFCKIKEMG